ncbi:MAG: small multi-drug export protein [bacterium]
MSPTFFIELFKHFPPQLSTFLIAMLPVGELRAAIPIALKYYELSYFSAYFWSVLGNMIPAFLIIKYIGGISDYLSKKSKYLNQFFIWLFAKTRKKFDHNYNKYGMIALALFVAIPLPATGAWSGSLAAWMFGLPKKKSLAYIFIGVLIAGLVVSLVSAGVFRLL